MTSRRQARLLVALLLVTACGDGDGETGGSAPADTTEAPRRDHGARHRAGRRGRRHRQPVAHVEDMIVRAVVRNRPLGVVRLVGSDDRNRGGENVARRRVQGRRAIGEDVT